MAILWTEVKRNERPDFRSTVESRLRASGVLDALYLARVENTEFYNGIRNPDEKEPLKHDKRIDV